VKQFAFTLDLEPDYAGVVNQYEIFKDLEKVEEFLSVISALNVKITVFTLGEIFDYFPAVIRLFEKYCCEFEVHSYSHNFQHPDSEAEIMQSKEAYYKYFKRNPCGYRAPRGMISHTGIKTLEAHGFLYDSSIFPSYFPNPFKYLLCNKQIHRYSNSSIIEIPFTVVTPFRITLSVSYIKLLGLNLFKKVFLPDTVCFGSHLHDFIINEYSFNKLPFYQKTLYGRNKHKGIQYCIEFLEHVKHKGYQFCYISDLYNMHKNNMDVIY